MSLFQFLVKWRHFVSDIYLFLSSVILLNLHDKSGFLIAKAFLFQPGLVFNLSSLV